jgi:hypothetical protein
MQFPEGAIALKKGTPATITADAEGNKLLDTWIGDFELGRATAGAALPKRSSTVASGAGKRSRCPSTKNPPALSRGACVSSQPTRTLASPASSPPRLRSLLPRHANRHRAHTPGFWQRSHVERVVHLNVGAGEVLALAADVRSVCVQNQCPVRGRRVSTAFSVVIWRCRRPVVASTPAGTESVARPHVAGVRQWRVVHGCDRDGSTPRWIAVRESRADELTCGRRWVALCRSRLRDDACAGAMVATTVKLTFRRSLVPCTR